MDNDTGTTRRDLIKLGVGAAVGLATLPAAFAQKPQPLITKAIPSSGQRLPVVGLGTNRFAATAPDELAARRAVLRRLAELGGLVVDTAPAYGQSEEVIGQLVSELRNRERLWIATEGYLGRRSSRGTQDARRLLAPAAHRPAGAGAGAQPAGREGDAAGPSRMEAGEADQVRRHHHVAAGAVRGDAAAHAARDPGLHPGGLLDRQAGRGRTGAPARRRARHGGAGQPAVRGSAPERAFRKSANDRCRRGRPTSRLGASRSYS